jgi:heme A synthase
VTGSFRVVGFPTRGKGPIVGRGRPLGRQVLLRLVLIVLAAVAGAAVALLRGRPYLDGALVCGGAVLLVSLVALVARVVPPPGRLRSRDR